MGWRYLPSPHVVHLASLEQVAQLERQALHVAGPFAYRPVAHLAQVVSSWLQSAHPRTVQSRHSRPVVPVPWLARGQDARQDCLSRARYLLLPHVTQVPVVAQSAQFVMVAHSWHEEASLAAENRPDEQAVHVASAVAVPVVTPSPTGHVTTEWSWHAPALSAPLYWPSLHDAQAESSAVFEPSVYPKPAPQAKIDLDEQLVLPREAVNFPTPHKLQAAPTDPV